ncbi:MAG: dihydroorotate dehydrogenase electron transfer subunit [Lachnospiraceae bacterium]|nr:dihydroorotate dehydrogenase electron transfer subunit [Lachnospiraceae bacterium]
MAVKKKETVQVLSTARLAEDVYEMWLATDLAKDPGAGRFLTLYPKNRAALLPRPISICERDAEREALRIVYRIAGEGTREFSTYKEGDTAEILGILGNGYPLDPAKGKRALLLGGGIGIPPLLELAKELGEGEKYIVAGYRNGQLFLKEDLEKYGRVFIATEDGSRGTKGNVLDAVRENELEADLIYACGPLPMLRAIKEYAAKRQIPAWISLEERMACGVGACLGCVCKTVRKDAHSHVNNARICTDGPVFPAEDVDI